MSHLVLKNFYKCSLIISLCIFVSCEKSYEFENAKSISSAKWEKDKTIDFRFKVEDTVSFHDMFLMVRNNNDYNYRNLYLFTYLEFPNGKTRVDTANCLLANKKGRWLGDGIGDIKENLFQYMNKKRFPLKGEYKVSIQHAMRTDTLKGVMDIGFKLKKRK